MWTGTEILVRCVVVATSTAVCGCCFSENHGEGARSSSLSRLVRIANSPSHTKRYNAIDSLGQMFTADASSPLADIMENSDEVARRHAALALGQLAMGMYVNEDVVEKLQLLLADETYSSREYVAHVLCRVGTSECVISLAMALAKGDERLRMAILDGLRLAFSGVLRYGHPELDRERKISLAAGETVIGALVELAKTGSDDGLGGKIERTIRYIKNHRGKTWAVTAARQETLKR